jgi:hypothetical protein
MSQGALQTGISRTTFFSGGGKAMRNIHSLLICVGVCLLASAAAWATGIPHVESVVTAAETEASIFILPDGTGSPLASCVGAGGLPADARITARLVDANGAFIPAFPAEDMWLSFESPLVQCCGQMGFLAEAASDAEGYVYFSQPLAGGGYCEGPLWFYLNGMRAENPVDGELPPLALRANSPDINADGVIDLADIHLFAADFFGEYHYRSDFYWDGVINLADVGMMAQGPGHGCP